MLLLNSVTVVDPSKLKTYRKKKL